MLHVITLQGIKNKGEKMSARTFDISKTKKFGNVAVIHDESKISVILHQTEVVRFDKVLNKVYVTSGGWMTPTTKTAINNALTQLERITGQSLSGIYQKKGEWFFADGSKFKDGTEISLYPLMQALA